MLTDLLDINVWLALTDVEHAHHARAKQYWDEQSHPQMAFCRVSMLGLLRLATNSKVMRGQAFTPTEIWQAYREYRNLPEIIFLPEPFELEKQMIVWSNRDTFAVHRWTDCYLAAFAVCQACRLVSFDRDFKSFAGLDFLHLTI